MTVSKTLFTAVSAIALSAMLLTPHAAEARDNKHNGHAITHNRKAPAKPPGHQPAFRNPPHHNHGANKKVVYVTPRYYPAPVYNYYPARTTYYYAPVHGFVGQRLVTYHAVPQHMLVRLQPAPHGYYYSRYDDGNVFLVRQHDNIIEQIVSLLLR